MKLTKTASGKKIVKMSKKEWLELGKKAGWIKEAGYQEQQEVKKHQNDAAALRNELLKQYRIFSQGRDDRYDKDIQMKIYSSLYQGVTNAPDLASSISAMDDAAQGFDSLRLTDAGKKCRQIMHGFQGRSLEY